MTSVGVRELRQRARELLRRIERGETIQVTDHGRPVAILSPPPSGNVLEQLRTLGEMEPGSGSLDDLPQPLILPPGIERPSDVLRRLRHDER